MEVKGNALGERVPRTEEIKSAEVREALAECVWHIIDTVHEALEQIPPEISGDIVDRGILLTGGGSLLKNIDKSVREATRLPVFLSDNPFQASVLGTGKMLTDMKLLRKVSMN